jgi:sugar/nucleoside kinase (ribokinase family)
MKKKKFDILSVGELLVDFISTDFADRLEEVSNFKKLQGGSPANMCMNMARLGNQSRLVATVGKDDMGHFLINEVKRVGVDTNGIRQVAIPSTLILVTRSKEVSNFEAYRSADIQIANEQFPIEDLEDTAIFHTTCFGLSKEPARSAILNMAEEAVAKGCQLSIDANYASKIWPKQDEAQAVVASYVNKGALVKVSEVDWERLYDHPIKDPKDAADFFLAMGAKEVCITLGGDGCLVADHQQHYFLPSRSIEVKDTTGAGDAFWSGYLTAHLDGCQLLDKAKAGRKMAELKLTTFGSLPNKVDRSQLYID